MRIRRDRSRPLFRKQSRRGGCLPWLMLLGVMTVTAFVVSRIPIPGIDTISPPQIPPDMSQARAAFAQGNLNATINITRRLLTQPEDDPLPALTLLVRALIYRSYNDYDRAADRRLALDLVEEHLAHNPGDAPLIALQAYILQAEGESDNAYRKALRVIERDPASVPARLALSLSYGSQGIFEAALREAEYAVNLMQTNPSDWKLDALRVRALAQSDLARYDDAIQSVRAAIQINRRLAALHYEHALYALQIGNTDSATTSYFNVIAFDPDNIKARLRLCEVSSTLRERDAAITYCNEVTQRAPDWSEGWYFLGREYFLQGDFAAAQQALHQCSTLQVQQAVPISQRRFACWYLQGQAAEVRGDCDSLLATYREFQTMRARASIPETWTYPPEGPPMCVTPAPDT